MDEVYLRIRDIATVTCPPGLNMIDSDAGTDARTRLLIESAKFPRNCHSALQSSSPSPVCKAHERSYRSYKDQQAA